jgi:phosphatidylinositol alpha-1,6-mannosyltransferase
VSPAPERRRVALVTSGLGPAQGGVGVVAASLARALGPRTALWRHHHRWPAAARRAALVARACAGALARPGLVVYEHVDLAAIHAVVPGLGAVPHAVFLHGTEVWRPLEARRRAALERAGRLLANSAATVVEARRHNPWLPEVTVTHLGIAPVEPGAPAGARPPLALMVGRMSSRERYKGHEQVLLAWPAIRAALPAAELVVVGEGDDRARLETLAAGLPGVRFTGWVPDAERIALVRAARLLLQPSLREGFGLAAVEAAAAGTPVLGLRGAVIEELFPSGGVALAASQAPADLAAAATPVLSDAAAAARLGEAGAARVRERFLESHFIERVRAALAPWVS